MESAWAAVPSRRKPPSVAIVRVVWVGLIGQAP
jgi:hypothetical protein